jgi:hypothetical protein
MEIVFQIEELNDLNYHHRNNQRAYVNSNMLHYNQHIHRWNICIKNDIGFWSRTE